MLFFRLRGKANPLAIDYVLPDYTNVKRGFVRKPGESSQQNEQVKLRKKENLTDEEYIKLTRPT